VPIQSTHGYYTICSGCYAILDVSLIYPTLMDYGSWKGHIHKVLADRYDNTIYVVVGDDAYNRTTFYTKDYGATWNTFGYGSMYAQLPERPTSGVALADRIIWGDDAGGTAG